MKQKILKIGNSLGVTVPANFVKTMGIKSGRWVEVKIIPNKGKIVYTFEGVYQLPLLEVTKKNA